jgi:hypothetical protein
MNSFPQHLTQSLIKGLKNDNYKIRVGDTKIIYLLSRFLPKIAWNIINGKANETQLQN